MLLQPRLLNDVAHQTLCHHVFDAVLINSTHTFMGNQQLHKAFLAWNPKTMPLQVRQKTSTCSPLGVGHIVAR